MLTPHQARWSNDRRCASSHRTLVVVLTLALLCFGPCVPLFASGTIRGWGSNSEGQSLPPTVLNDVVGVAAGGLHSIALRANGKVLAWGWNVLGETNVPAGLDDVAAIAANYGYNLALRRDGTVAAWGTGPAVGVPPGLSSVVALAAGYDHALALRSDGTVVSWGNAPELPGPLTNVVAIAAGRGHSLALQDDGTVVAWGDNTAGKLAIPPGLRDVVAIAAGDHHNLALRSDGTVVAWGANDKRQSTVPTGLSNVVAIAAGSAHSLALRANGTVVGWGDNTFGQATPPPGLSSVVAISGGLYHSLAIVGDGRPVITVPPRSRTGMLGQRVELAVMAAGQAPLEYRWYKDGTLLSNVTGSRLRIDNAAPEHEGLYFAVVSNALGTVTSAVARLTVRPMAPAIVFQPSDTSVVCGESTLLETAAEGTGLLQFQWFFEGTPLEGATNRTLLLPRVTPASAGAYWVTVTSEYGAATSRTATVTVRVEPPAITGPSSVNGKQGVPFTATVRARYSPESFGAWGLPPGLSLNPTNGVISGIPTQPGTYTVLLSATNACTHATATLTLRIASSVPVITSPPLAQGAEDQPFTYQITATEQPTLYGAENLPAGLAVDPTTGQIRGVPAVSGEFDVTVFARNPWGEGRSTIRFSIAPRQLAGLAIANVTYTYSTPYLLDFQFSLYDSDDPSVARPVVVPPTNLWVVAKENDRPISTNETAWLLAPGAGLGKLIKVALVLDFSWSVASLANGDTNDNGISDALEAMVAASRDLVARLPKGSQVGVVEFHREDQDPAIVHPLSADVVSVQNAIAGIWTNHVQGFPAGSRVWDAIAAGISMLGASNADEQHYVVFVSDGRDESSSTTVDDLITTATNANVRIYGLGFGLELDPTDLQRLTTATAGRLVLATNVEEMVAQIGQLAQDVSGQYILRWASLRRGSTAVMPSFEVHYQGLIAYSPTNPVWTNFDNPIIDTNETPPTTNYPLVTNYIIGWFIPADHAGDVTLGRLRLVPDDRDGEPALTLRALYLPRFIRQIQLRYRPNWPCTVSLLSTEPGQLLHGWSLAETQAPDGLRIALLSSPNPTNLATSLPYGAFGSLLQFTFRELDSLSNAFAFIEVDNALYSNTGPQRLMIENSNQFSRAYPPLPLGTPVPWLFLHGFTNNLAAAELGDPDGDGMPTWLEYRADTDPRDAGSVLALRFLPAVPWVSFHQVAFPTSARRFYRVERSTDLESWEAITPDFAGTGGEVIVTDPSPPWAMPAAYYRVAVW